MRHSTSDHDVVHYNRLRKCILYPSGNRYASNKLFWVNNFLVIFWVNIVNSNVFPNKRAF